MKYYVFGDLPDYILISNANALDKTKDPLGLVHLIGYELEDRRPESVQHLDNNGREIKTEMIGYDDNGREIWLDM